MENITFLCLGLRGGLSSPCATELLYVSCEEVMAGYLISLLADVIIQYHLLLFSLH